MSSNTVAFLAPPGTSARPARRVNTARTRARSEIRTNPLIFRDSGFGNSGIAARSGSTIVSGFTLGASKGPRGSRLPIPRLAIVHSPGCAVSQPADARRGCRPPPLPERPPAVFRCFSTKLSATGNVSSAEILTFGRYGARKNSGEVRCFPLLSRGRACVDSNKFITTHDTTFARKTQAII